MSLGQASVCTSTRAWHEKDQSQVLVTAGAGSLRSCRIGPLVGAGRGPDWSEAGCQCQCPRLAARRAPTRHHDGPAGRLGIMLAPAPPGRGPGAPRRAKAAAGWTARDPGIADCELASECPSACILAEAAGARQPRPVPCPPALPLPFFFPYTPCRTRLGH